MTEDRNGPVGQLASQTIYGQTVAWKWSAIEFNSAGTPRYNDVRMFPT